ncbi:hypothetical protein QBC44DRAFT_404998 [Cladorrhinum sp. PSN332]|nr:hypothetical protein QBC44DRAFT_404998 [Cladorrhinum sp. PSN332]
MAAFQERVNGRREWILGEVGAFFHTPKAREAYIERAEKGVCPRLHRHEGWGVGEKKSMPEDLSRWYADKQMWETYFNVDLLQRPFPFNHQKPDNLGESRSKTFEEYIQKQAETADHSMSLEEPIRKQKRPAADTPSYDPASSPAVGKKIAIKATPAAQVTEYSSLIKTQAEAEDHDVLWISQTWGSYSPSCGRGQPLSNHGIFAVPLLDSAEWEELISPHHLANAQRLIDPGRRTLGRKISRAKGGRTAR